MDISQPKNDVNNELKDNFKLERSTFIKRSENEKEILVDVEDLKEQGELGSGEFGVVFKMMHTKSDLKCAVKVLT